MTAKNCKKMNMLFEMHTGNMVHTSACNAYLDVLHLHTSTLLLSSSSHSFDTQVILENVQL